MKKILVLAVAMILMASVVGGGVAWAEAGDKFEIAFGSPTVENGQPVNAEWPPLVVTIKAASPGTKRPIIAYILYEDGNRR